MLSKVLVTGGTGFIGSFLVERLVEQGKDVRVLDNNFRGRPEYLEHIKDKIELIDGDIRNMEDIKSSLKGVEVCYHLAAINGTKYFYEIPDEILDVNAQGTINVIKALEGTDVKKFINFSSSEIYGGKPEYFPTDEMHKLVVDDPSNPRWTYSGSKIIGEIYSHIFCKKFDIDYCNVRPHNFYGPRMGYSHVIGEFIERIEKKEEFTMQGDGKQMRSFLYIDDAIDAIVKTEDVRLDGIPLNIGHDKDEFTMLEVAHKLAEIAGVELEIKHVGLPKGGTLRRLPTIENARKILGWEPKTSFEQGLKKTYDWYIEDLKKR